MSEIVGAAAAFITEPLSFAFMQRALVGCILVGVLCAVLGVYVVLQNLSFIGEGLAHGALPGLAIGYALKWNLYLSALAVSLGLAAAIAFMRDKGRIASDTAIAIALSAAAATGIALIGVVRFGGVDLNSYLFGNVLAIGDTDLIILTVAGVAIVALQLVLAKEYAFIAFDPDAAVASGVPVRLLSYVFLLIVAGAVVVSLQTVGLILVTSLLVIPAASARQWANRLPSMTLLAVAFGIVSAVLGLFLSFHLRLASGATIVLVAALIFVVSFASRGWRERRKAAG